MKLSRDQLKKNILDAVRNGKPEQAIFWKDQLMKLNIQKKDKKNKDVKDFESGL